ncbi:CIR protein [Plasmodium chabaudi adami]|uniref:CIR protein n=1 Tax=Plasmodium chabaudi adami TaxID=5826 RepID=A0A1C6WGN4_PLACE|nr:CIR protein [Plasmodium chabaudi adami]
MGMKSCETFLEVDKLFINYKTNEEKFSTNSGLYYQYCPVERGSKRCNNDYEKLKAISEYAFRELAKNDKVNLDSGYDPSADYVFMGWCHRLYNISKDHNLYLNQSYGNNLGRSIGDFNYKGILNNKKHLIDSNIAIMNMFYLLFQQICKTINIYETHKEQTYEYISSAAQCHIMFNKLSNFVNQCGPYLRLFNYLKTIYDEYIKAVIKDNDYDQSLSSQLIELSSIDKTKFGSDLNSVGCKRVHQMLEKKISRVKNDPQEEEDELSILIELLVSDDDEDADGDDADNDNGDDSEKRFYIIKNIDNTSKNHEKDPGKLSDQSNMSNDDPNHPDRDTTNNTDYSNDKDQTEHKQEKTLENSKISDKSSENPSDEQLTKETTQENQDNIKETQDNTKETQDNTKETQDTTKKTQDTIKESKDDTHKKQDTTKESIVETLKSMKPAANFSKRDLSSFNNTLTNIGNNSYEKTLQNLQNTSSKHTEFVNEVNNAINQPDKETIIPPSDDNKYIPERSGSDLPSSDDPSIYPPPVPHSSQNPQTEPTKQSEPEHKQDEDQKEKDQQPTLTIQGASGGSINTPHVQVTKPDNSGNNINGIISESVSSMDILKKHKLIAFSVIGIAIPITLAIMYKYLSPWRTKKSKRKTKMKKIINLVGVNKTKKTVINSINGKKPMKIVINSSTKKKQTEKFITSVYRKNFPLLNIYKLMQADPVPFINLFFLFIFFVYKRTRGSIEL